MSIQQNSQMHKRIVVSVMLLVAALGLCTSQADQLIEDDLIVVGSECVGFDCALDENFSFSTQLLKENNLRIFFNDTSSSASFPANDWEIIVNDAANGGASFLGFADRLAGQTPVSGGGFCDGGTNNGLVCGVVEGEDCSGQCVGGDLPGASCFLGSPICSDNGGGTCEGAGMCVAPGAIVFIIEAGAPANSLKINSLGFVGLGTDAPAADLDVNGDAIIRGNLTVSGTVGGGTAQMCPANESVVGIAADGTIICAVVDKAEVISCDGFENCPPQ